MLCELLYGVAPTAGDSLLTHDMPLPALPREDCKHNGNLWFADTTTIVSSPTARVTGFCLVLLLVGCSDSGSASGFGTDTPTATAPVGTSTGGTPTTTDGTTEDPGGSMSTTVEPTAGSSTTESVVPSTGETGTTTASTTLETGTGDESTTAGDRPCVLADVEDTLAFTYNKSINLTISKIQASFYNPHAKEIVFFSIMGPGRRYSIDGAPLGDVQAPNEAVLLDGATFDPVNRTALLLSQGCRLVEVDPVTMAVLDTIQLDTAKLGLENCAGLTIGLDGHMYINSYFTNKVLVVTRDGQTEIKSIDLVPLGLPNPDGISLIAGSPNFLILSTVGSRSAIMSPDGVVLVGPNASAQDKPPMIGGGIANPDAILTVCGNGHAWLCDEYGAKCHDYVPMDGDKDACSCLIPQ